MDQEDSVVAFHVEDPVLQRPVYRFNSEAMSHLLPQGGRVLDLGCGSGRLLADLARARPDLEVIGVDLADGMLMAGSTALRDEGLSDRVTLHHADMTDLPGHLVEGVDLVSSVWSLHHLPTEEDLHRCLVQIARTRETSGCAVWIFDFARLRLDETFPALMQLAPAAPARLREDGIASERAAWAEAELRTAMGTAGLGDLEGGPETSLGHYQAYHGQRADQQPDAHQTLWSADPLTSPSREVLDRLRIGMPRGPQPESDTPGHRTAPRT